MGMDWLKGVVGATNQMIPAGQQVPPAWTPYGAPQPGGPMPGSPPGYGGPPGGGMPGAAPGWGSPGGTPGAAQGGPAGWGPPGTGPAAAAPAWPAAPAGTPGGPGAPAPAWAPQGTGPAAAPPAWQGAPGGAAAPAAAGPEGRIAMLEGRCEELRRDVESIALFARTLLTLLEERQVVTQQQFQETKQKLDMLDGKMDDRISSGS